MRVTRSTLVASALTATAGLSLAVAGPATAAGPSSSSAKAPAAKAAKKTKKSTKAKKNRTTKVTACVRRKSGATRVLLGTKAKRKCGKGWTKVTWNVRGKDGKAGKNGRNGVNGAPGAPGATGARGLTGADGRPLSVRDANGTRIGGFGGYFGQPGTPLALLQVIGDDGGVYTYLDSAGVLFPTTMMGMGGNLSPVFQDPACAGPASVGLGTGAPVSLAPLLGGSLRIVHRAANVASFEFGPVRAWKLSAATTVAPPAATFYALDMSGACVALDPTDSSTPSPGSYLMTLTPTTPPRDGVGPLTVG
jgi:hypothetical protein